MPNAIEKLESEAIEAALQKDWKRAIQINNEIVNFDSENVSALNRLAKAYLELEKYDDSKKVLKKVLKIDPINQTAKKNLELALSRRKVIGSSPLPDIKNFIKEPGTTKEFTLFILSKGMTGKKFYTGEPLQTRIEGHRLSVHKSSGELVNVFENATAEKLISALKKGAKLSVTFKSGNEKEIVVLVKSSIPLFKTEKQDLKPYIKRETIEEPEIELSIPDQEEA